MKLKLSLFLFLILASPLFSLAQSKTTERLHKKHEDALSLFFYNNTLRMLNQNEDKQFDELIKDIEKMKFLMIKKDPEFATADYKKLVGDYKAESFEEIMTSRHEGKNFDVYLKEKDKKTIGMLVLINDSSNLYVLDIVGRIALDNVTKLYQMLDESADIGKKIKAFTGEADERKGKKH
ncbi:MAG: DUF4252 domain-containing protein [Bacteroidota bacterium]